ncbi:hypothetical protein SADUNF_Sadunf13G0080800 [Salix dunnii]|uniref:Uncharacterized protein n=1 Tax=Salix dunnii TaxID=1413687 RepID=A0A835MRB3_9ROSI|nr:hypothetical protein SADUNF_Sadunf13G0080800 [Salix dunnii]
MDYMDQQGIPFKPTTFSAPEVASELVKLLASCALVRRAKSLFYAVPVKAYGYNEQWKDAIKLFDGMRTIWRFTINDFTFKAVPSISDQAGFSDDAC